MSSFYGNCWGGNSGNGNTGSATNNIVFLNSKNDLPATGEKDTLYVTQLDGIFIYDENTDDYISTTAASIDLEWISYGG